jgi:hypothetical protein
MKTFRLCLVLALFAPTPLAINAAETDSFDELI